MRYPICAAEVALPCRCQALFDGLAAEMQHLKLVEAHQGVTKHDTRAAIQRRMVEAWLNHQNGRHLVDPRELEQP